MVESFISLFSWVPDSESCSCNGSLRCINVKPIPKHCLFPSATRTGEVERDTGRRSWKCRLYEFCVCVLLWRDTSLSWFYAPVSAQETSARSVVAICMKSCARQTFAPTMFSAICETTICCIQWWPIFAWIYILAKVERRDGAWRCLGWWCYCVERLLILVRKALAFAANRSVLIFSTSLLVAFGHRWSRFQYVDR